MKIAVTSASGQLGSVIVKNLIKEIGKENVVAIARTPHKVEHLGVEVRKGDYNDRNQFNEALKGIDKVLLVSGMDEAEKRVQQHRNVIEAAKQNGVQKIVYTSIIGDEEKTAFRSIVKSNRQTEKDIQASSLDWVIGRNGIYIEPDLDYLETYIKEGEIRNSAANGKCAYTSRGELGYAYTQMLINDHLNNNTFNLAGESITQSDLVELINKVFQTNLKYNSISVEAYAAERKAELGNFMGTIIAGIYEGIRIGVNDVSSDFKKVAQRPHQSPVEMMESYRISTQ